MVASPSLRLWHKELLKITTMPDYEEQYDATVRAELSQKLHRARSALDEKEDRISNLLVCLGALHGGYVGVVSSLLSLFTPQICPATAAAPLPHSCTLHENTRGLSAFNAAILALNFFTLFTILLTELLVFRRERFMNKNFTVDDAFPSNNLSRPSIPLPDGGYASLFDKHASLAAALRLSNRAVAASSKICSLTIVCNVSLSAAFILSQRSDGFRSVLSLISATMLIGTRFLTASFVCSAGAATDDRGHASVSLYTKLHAVFNRLDEANDVENNVKTSATPSGRLKGFGLEQLMADKGEDVLQLKQMPKTKAALSGVQSKCLAVLSVCTGSDVVREGNDEDETAAPPADVQAPAEAAGEEDAEAQRRRCQPCGAGRKAEAAAEGGGVGEDAV